MLPGTPAAAIWMMVGLSLAPEWAQSRDFSPVVTRAKRSVAQADHAVATAPDDSRATAATSSACPAEDSRGEPGDGQSPKPCGVMTDQHVRLVQFDAAAGTVLIPGAARASQAMGGSAPRRYMRNGSGIHRSRSAAYPVMSEERQPDLRQSSGDSTPDTAGRQGVVSVARKYNEPANVKTATVVRAGRHDVSLVSRAMGGAAIGHSPAGPSGPTGFIYHGPGVAAESHPLCDDLVPLRDLKVNMVASAGELPENYAAFCFADKPIVVNGEVAGRMWSTSLFQWEATALCYNQLYFEEAALERDGYSYGIFQPAVSAGHFFCTVPALPYLMTCHRPRECIYTLGHTRPGDRVPYSIIHPPLRADAAIVEGLFWTGLIFLVP
jgi:hypothetical protein